MQQKEVKGAYKGTEALDLNFVNKYIPKLRLTCFKVIPRALNRQPQLHQCKLDTFSITPIHGNNTRAPNDKQRGRSALYCPLRS